MVVVVADNEGTVAVEVVAEDLELDHFPMDLAQEADNMVGPSVTVVDVLLDFLPIGSLRTVHKALELELLVASMAPKVYQPRQSAQVY